MANFKRAAKKLGLEDVGKANLGDKQCFCSEGLRFGEDENKHVVSYCPKCVKIIATIKIPRLGPKIKVPPHDDG